MRLAVKVAKQHWRENCSKAAKRNQHDNVRREHPAAPPGASVHVPIATLFPLRATGADVGYIQTPGNQALRLRCIAMLLVIRETICRRIPGWLADAIIAVATEQPSLVEPHRTQGHGRVQLWENIAAGPRRVGCRVAHRVTFSAAKAVPFRIRCQRHAAFWTSTVGLYLARAQTARRTEKLYPRVESAFVVFV